jgi:hypothetical protein
VAAVDGSRADSFFRIGSAINRKESPHGWAFERQIAVIRRDIEKEVSLR